MTYHTTLIGQLVAKCRGHACIENVCLNNKLVSCD